MGGIYKEQKEFATISNPSLLITKSTKLVDRKEKKLIVLHNFTSLEICSCIMREMKDASTDIIVVSNELFCKEEIAKEFDKCFNRGCNIIEVTNLQPISIMQRMVYGLLEKNSFVARDADHIVFTLLSEYSRGAATIVHLLTSVMQKCGDSRTGFELVKQQLKLHIAHQKGLKTHENTTENSISTTDSVVSSQDISDITSTSSSLSTKPDTEDIDFRLNASTFSSTVCTKFDSEEASDTSSASSFAKSDSDYESMHDTDKNLIRSGSVIEVALNNITDDFASKSWFQNMSTNSRYTEDVTVTVDGYTKQRDAALSGSDEEDALVILPEGYETVKDDPPTLQYSLHLFINDLLTSDEFSIPAYHFLNCLCIIGSVPIPLFLIKELDRIITEATIGKNNGMHISATPLIKQLKPGVLRKYPHMFLYHKDFNPEFLDSTTKLKYIPKLLCDVIKGNMHSGDVALSIACIQHAAKNVLMNQLNINQLCFMLVVLNQLDDSCSSLHGKFNEENVRLKVWVAYSVGLHKEEY